MHISVTEPTTADLLAAATAADQERSWMRDAACIGYSSLFFAPVAERPQARARREAKALKLCMRCEHRLECRDYARDHREFGYWGGENEEERTIAGFAVPNPIGARRKQAS